MELSELALLNNKSDFFELLMERVELNDFLTTQRLKDLYEKVHSSFTVQHFACIGMFSRCLVGNYKYEKI